MLDQDILVVDDDPGVCTLLTALLTRAGFAVEVAEDGAAAIEKIRRKCHAAILLDLMLPKSNGFEIIRMVRSDRPHLMKRIIIVTAAANRTLEHFSDQSEVFALVRKPFDIDELLDRIRTCTSQEG